MAPSRGFLGADDRPGAVNSSRCSRSRWPARPQAFPAPTPPTPRCSAAPGHAPLAYLRIGVDPERISAEDLEATIRRPSRGVSRERGANATKRGWSSLSDVRRLAGRLSGRDVSEVGLLCQRPRGGGPAARSRRRLPCAPCARRSGSLRPWMCPLFTPGGGSVDSADDLLALESVATLLPDAAFEAWLREMLAGRSLWRRRAPLHYPQDERTRVGPGDRLRGVRGPSSAPPER